MAQFDYDLFTIGAGSGGVRASRVSASHGARVAVAEEHKVGGTCVIRGCVPKKLLFYGSHFAEDLEDAANYGWTIDGLKFDWPTLRDHVLRDVDRLNGLYQQTLDTHEVETFLERATITGPNSVKLASGREVTAGKILIATGSWPAMPDVEGIEHCLTSNEMFHLEKLPERLVVIGGGYIAMEFAGIFNALGSEVTILNRSETILRGYERAVVDRLVQITLARGIDLRLNAPFEKVTKGKDGKLMVHCGKRDPLEADAVLVATGRSPNVDKLGLDKAGVELNDRGAIKVDEQARTSCDSIFAVGDVTDRVQLTPVAIREGQAFADTQFGGKETSVDYGCIPSAVFSHPPMAGVGMTEGDARNSLGKVRIYSSDFRAMKNVFADRAERGLYKMIVDDATDKIVGLHMIGPEAPEILQAAAIAVKAGLTKADFDATVALHPSMAEELVLMK